MLLTWSLPWACLSTMKQKRQRLHRRLCTANPASSPNTLSFSSWTQRRCFRVAPASPTAFGVNLQIPLPFLTNNWMVIQVPTPMMSSHQYVAFPLPHRQRAQAEPPHPVRVAVQRFPVVNSSCCDVFQTRCPHFVSIITLGSPGFPAAATACASAQRNCRLAQPAHCTVRPQ